MTDVFRLARPFVLRMFGWQMIYAGAGVVVAVFLISFDGWIETVGVVVAVLSGLAALVALRLLILPAPVAIKLTESGYRAGWRAGGRRVRGTWAAVNRVSRVEGTHLSFELAGGDRQAFWLPLVGSRVDELYAAVQKRADDSRGYRPLA